MLGFEDGGIERVLGSAVQAIKAFVIRGPVAEDFAWDWDSFRENSGFRR